MARINLTGNMVITNNLSLKAEAKIDILKNTNKRILESIRDIAPIYFKETVNDKLVSLDWKTDFVVLSMNDVNKLHSILNKISRNADNIQDIIDVKEMLTK